MNKFTIVNLFGEEKVKEKKTIKMELDSDTINKLLNVKESFFASNQLKKILSNKEKRESLFEEFLTIEQDLSYDWFTDYFQEEQSDRKNKKQDFTPDGVVSLMSEILGETNSNTDIASGTGGLTIKVWNSNKNAFLYCEEFSDRALPFLLFNLSIRNTNARVLHGNSLTREVFKVYNLTKNEKFSDIIELDELEEIKTDTAIMNPPYSMAWEPQRNFMYEKRFVDYGLAPNSKADFAFLLQGLYNLKEGGKLVIILPHGVLFRSGAEQNIRERLIEKGYITNIIGLPEKLFYNTAIATVILIIYKKESNNGVHFINAVEEYEEEKPINVLKEKNKVKILKAIQERTFLNRFSILVNYDNIKKNDYNLNIPRYVDMHIPEKLPSYSELAKELQEINDEIKKTKKELDEMMSDLTANDTQIDEEFKKYLAIFKE